MVFRCKVMDRRFILFLTIFIDLLGFGLVIPILPNWIRDLMGSEVWVGFAIALFSIMQFLFSPLFGSLSDRIGRRPVLMITLAANAVGYVLLGFSEGIILLFIARAINGIASGNISVAQAYLIDITPPEKRSGALGLIGAAFGLGFIFGPPLGGIIMGEFGFAYVGWFAALLCVINLILAYYILPESLETRNSEARLRLVPVDDYREALSHPIIRRMFLINFLYIAAFFLFQVCSTLFWEEHFGLDAKQRGYAFAFLGVCTALVQGLMIRKLSATFGDERLLLIGNIGMAIVLVFLGLVPSNLFVELELPLIFLMSMVNGPVGPSSMALLSRQVDPRSQGKVIGLYQSFGSLARVAGPILGTTLYAQNYLLPFLTAGVLLVVNAYLAVQAIKAMAAHTGPVHSAVGASRHKP